MTPKPNAKTTPSQDEFDSWCLHPVTQYVAEAYRIGATKQRDEWQRQFDQRLIPADIQLTRLELKTREDAYLAFLETQLDDYVAVVEGNKPGGAVRPSQPIQTKGPDYRRYSRA